MKKIRIYIPSVLSFALLAFVISACGANESKTREANYREFMANDSIPEVLKNIVDAIYNDDPSLFAAQVAYPLQRPYPLKDINSQSEMEAYYHIMVDDSLRNVILSSRPEEWHEYGWRGWSLHDGEYFWTADSLYAVNYISKREHELIDSLLTAERNSLPRQFKEGWTPVITFRSEEKRKIYRIDQLTASAGKYNSVYRLSIFDCDENSPDVHSGLEEIMEGTDKIEGSAGTVSYIFTDNKGRDYVIFPEEPSSGTPALLEPDGSRIDLEKAYWLELIK